MRHVCPAFSACPLKTVIGDFKEPQQTDVKPQAGETERDQK